MTPVKSSPPPTSRHGHWLWLFMLALGSLTLVVAWTALALATGRQHGWMALLAALEAAWMLRLGGMPAGWPRPLVCMSKRSVTTSGEACCRSLSAQWAASAGTGPTKSADFSSFAEHRRWDSVSTR